jgi:hypothetical protein
VSFNFLFIGMPPVGLTAGDFAMLVVKTIGVQDPEGFQLRPPVKIGGMTAGLDSLLRRMHPQSVLPLSLKNNEGGETDGWNVVGKK